MITFPYYANSQFRGFFQRKTADKNITMVQFGEADCENEADSKTSFCLFRKIYIHYPCFGNASELRGSSSTVKSSCYPYLVLVNIVNLVVKLDNCPLQ